MANNYMQGKYQVKNPEKYVGKGAPSYRSGWEFTVFNFCDNNPAILQWASEAIHVPYRNPFTNKNTIYVPDIFWVYVDKNGQKHAELVEIKPTKEVTMEHARTVRDKAAVALNMSKWEAARAFCKKQGLVFRIITENEIYMNVKGRK